MMTCSAVLAAVGDVCLEVPLTAAQTLRIAIFEGSKTVVEATKKETSRWKKQRSILKNPAWHSGIALLAVTTRLLIM